MKWIGKRISFVDHTHKTTVIIDPEKKFWVNTLMGAWLAMWWVIGATLTWAFNVLILNNQEKIILFVMLVFWAYYAWRVTRSFLWLLFGKEKIKIDEVGIHIKKALGKYGKSNVYYHENIQSITLEFPDKNSIQEVWESSPWINGGERFSFVYFDKPVRFGKKLQENDAKVLLSFLVKRSQQFLKK